MCSGSPPQDTTNQDKYAEMIDWMGDDWETRFKPIEEGLLDEVMNKDANIRKNVEAAGEAANTSYEATLGMSERNMARYGTEMSEDQQAAMDASNDLSQQGAQIGAQGMARDASTARYDQLQQGMMSLGTGIKTGAISGMGSAANMEANRYSQNQQIYGQSQAGIWNSIGSIAGMAGMMMISDRNAKQNIRPASAKKALKDIESVELKHYDYKPGRSGGRPEQDHIGGMAQDMPDSMTSDDKKAVDVGDSLMTLVGATQELSRKVKQMERRNVS